MPVTRSAVKKQTKLEDFGPEAQSKVERSKDEKHGQPMTEDQSAPNTSSKRKNSQTKETKDQPRKKKAQQHITSDSVENLENPIVINRAPVLQVWGAVVAQFLYPQLGWPACLSVGNAISSLCAISKGRAIGMIEPKDGNEPKEQEHENRVSKNVTQEVSVMGFSLHLENDAVLMSGKPKPFTEKALKSKFGEDHYMVVKNAMVESLETWTDNKEELDKKAFHMYEKFRPDVSKGQQGWGRKGELNLHEVANIIKRS